MTASRPDTCRPMPSTLNGANLDNTLGTLLIGVMIAAIVYGITVVQTYQYFRKSDSDSRILRALIMLLWVLDTVHQALLAFGLYTYVISDYGDIAALTTPTSSLLAAVVISATIEMIVRSLFSHRVWKLGRNAYMTAAIIGLSVIEFVWAGPAAHLNNFEKFTQLSPIFYVAVCAAIMADVLIASSQVATLWRLRTGFKRTDSIVRTLMLYSINTGLLTSVMAVVCLVTYVSMPDTFIYVAVYHIVSGLLLNALLATYNAKTELRNFESNVQVLSNPNNDRQGNLFTRSLSGRVHDERAIQISVVTVTDRKIDAMDKFDVFERASSLSN
ncbi:hypothetical protein OBBRIDRAFT_350577 [Obba rivulosa]|uniref:DUF6534 domain-containing protein n=1 Tax=Obba rivulosa TaxID=1052685 RepID=A0A8E2AZH6_9APHY|nr:hypothetical protein OBBRIDRAFT_350577 [Obba rivulosa]